MPSCALFGISKCDLLEQSSLSASVFESEEKLTPRRSGMQAFDFVRGEEKRYRSEDSNMASRSSEAKIIIRSYPPDTSDRDLRIMFEKYGKIDDRKRFFLLSCNVWTPIVGWVPEIILNKCIFSLLG